MTTTVTVAFTVLLACAAALILAIVVFRVARTVRVRRRAELAAGPRRLMLAFVADVADGADALVALPPAAWRAVEPAAIALLGKIRGEARQALVSVFEQRGAIDAARRELTARSAVRRARAAEALGNLGRADCVPALCALLEDPDPDVRVVVARALGRIAEPEAAGPLLDTLASDKPVPPQPVAHALIQIGPNGGPAVLSALGHPVPLVRVTALDVLGLIGVSGAAGPAAGVLAGDPALEVRIAAAAALGKIGRRPALAPLMAAVAADQPAPLRAAAARALGDLGAVAAVPPLVELLADPRHRVAHEAAHALRRVGPAGLAELRRVAASAPTPLAASVRAAVAASAPAPAPASSSSPGPGSASPSLPTPATVAPAMASSAAAYAREAVAMAGIGAQTGTPTAQPPAQTLAEAA